MPIARPSSLADALDALTTMPSPDLLAGGTDMMVEITYGDRRPGSVVALRRVAELAGWSLDDGHLRLGANVTYAQMQHDLADLAPGLAMVARTVGSPQIRNAGTIGGNLGTASPAGDTLPWLVAMDAEVELASVGGTRTLSVAEFVTGPKQTAREPTEIITSVQVPRVDGPQHVAKVGPRNAMVISVACVAFVLDTTNRRARTGLGAVGPTPLRATAAEDLATEAIDWDTLTCPDDAIDAVADACAGAAQPITDHRGTEEYRRHAVKILAARCLRRCLRT